MPNRRTFITQAALTLAAGNAMSQNPVPPQATPGAPPAFGTAPAAGPEVTTATFAEAEKLVQVPLSTRDRAQAEGNWRQSMAVLYERRVGPRSVAITDADLPYAQWSPVLPGQTGAPATAAFVRSHADPGPLPVSEAMIAFAPVTKLSRWIETRQLTSVRLTQIYLDRLRKYDPQLRCVITLTAEKAMHDAHFADQEIASGRYRGPLHGIPFGVKDLLDTAGIATTWGAEYQRGRIPEKDSTVVTRLQAAGAVLVAKLSLGALALNDIWFGGQTMNPWLPEEGSSGSSAGPGAATAAGLAAFSIGSETEGSIVSPSSRCGITGLRPTFGRVPRTGAMTLCWSLDKLGPMCRSVEDTMLVLAAIAGPDTGDPASVIPQPVHFDSSQGTGKLRVGYVPAWMKEANEVDRHALATFEKLGAQTVPVTLPDWPYGNLNVILFAEAAAAFEAPTLDHRVDQLHEQVDDAWPNTFRQARFLSAVDMVQADRLRRKVALEMVRVMNEVDVMLVPSLRDEMLTLSNFTGHPSLTLRAGFVEVAEARSDWAPNPVKPLPKFSPPRRVPYSVTLVGRLYDEGTLANAGMALEQALGVGAEPPPHFA